MAQWIKITEVKEPTGYYIGWHREHPKIHIKTDNLPYAKHSLVQIGGSKGLYEVLGQTVIHSVFAEPGTKGQIIYKGKYRAKNLSEAQRMATRLKRNLAKKFDRLSRD